MESSTTIFIEGIMGQNKEQTDQLKMRVMLATLIMQKLVSPTPNYLEIRNDALGYLHDLKENRFYVEQPEPKKLKKTRFSAKRIDTMTANKWEGHVNKKPVCRAKTEEAAIKIAKNIYRKGMMCK